MTENVPTACTLSCDSCNRQFSFNHSIVFASIQEARARAFVCGWQQHGEKDFCPQCNNKCYEKRTSNGQ